MYLDIRHKGKTIFFRHGPDAVALLAEARLSGIDISSKNIDDDNSQVYGTNFPVAKRDNTPRDWSEQAIARASILLLKLEIFQYEAPTGV